MKTFTIGVAAVALAAAGAVAAQGNGHGKGNDKGHAPQGHAQVAGSMTAASHGHGNAMQAAAHGRSGGSAMQSAMQAQGHGNAHATAKQEHGRGHEQAKAPAKPADHGNGHGQAMAEHDRGPDRGKADHAAPPPPPAAARNDARPAPAPDVRVLADGRRSYHARGARPAFDFAAVRRGPIDGCPPGLAKKHNGCRPPGLARQTFRQPAWWGIPRLGGNYFYDSGYLVRLNGDSIAGYVPLLGGALAVGNPWPSYYPPVSVPPYYVDYYGLGAPGGYRYADDVLYRVDPGTSAITAIAALLTGDTFAIGQPMPVGYDIYNVPYAYRGQYADGPNAWYRYSDGYVYQVDPTTRLVTAAIELLAT